MTGETRRNLDVEGQNSVLLCLHICSAAVPALSLDADAVPQIVTYFKGKFVVFTAAAEFIIR